MSEPDNKASAPAQKYAMLDLDGVRQLVMEEASYVVPASLVPPPGEGGDTIRLDKVVALRSDGTFTCGRPYLAGAAVEAVMEEEFCGPVPAALLVGSNASGAAPAASLMAKLRVTKIYTGRE